MPQRLLLPAPDTVEGDDIALLEPLGIALHGIDLSHFKPAMSAGVFGAGPIGLFLIRTLRALGAGRIIASDVKPHRVEAALASGADEAWLTAVDGQPEGIRDVAKVDVSFEVAGEDALIIHEVFSNNDGLKFHLTKGTAERYKKDIDQIAAPEAYFFRGPVSWTIRTYSKFLHLPATYSSLGSNATEPGGSMTDGQVD